MVGIKDDLRFNLPCGSELNPFVKKSSVIEFAEKPGLCYGVGRVSLKIKYN